MTTFKPSAARRGLDALLERYSFYDVLRVEWQREDPSRVAGPWVLVDLGQASEGPVEAFAVSKFAIWKMTGAVYTVDRRGGVADDPIIVGQG